MPLLTKRSAHTDWWPLGTTMLADDILVGGSSLRGLVDVSGTPVVTGGASVSSDRESTEVLVVRVVAMTRHRLGVGVVQVDARLDDLRLIWSQTRRVGGAPSIRERNVLVVRKPGRIDLADSDDVIAVSLPANLRVGDLLAIPSRPLAVDPLRPRHPLTGRVDGNPGSIFDSSFQHASRLESLE